METTTINVSKLKLDDVIIFRNGCRDVVRSVQLLTPGVIYPIEINGSLYTLSGHFMSDSEEHWRDIVGVKLCASTSVKQTAYLEGVVKALKTRISILEDEVKHYKNERGGVVTQLRRVIDELSD